MSGTLHQLMSHVGCGTSTSVTIFVKKVTLLGTYQEHYSDCVEHGSSMLVTIFQIVNFSLRFLALCQLLSVAVVWDI